MNIDVINDVVVTDMVRGPVMMFLCRELCKHPELYVHGLASYGELS